MLTHPVVLIFGLASVLIPVTPRTTCRLPGKSPLGPGMGFRRDRRGQPYVLQVLFSSGVGQAWRCNTWRCSGP